MDTSLVEIGSRLKYYLNIKKVGINELGRITKTSGSQISNIIKGKNYGMHIFLKVVDTFPELDIKWLILGQGDMEGDPQGQPPGKGSNYEEDTDIDARLKTLQQEKAALESKLSYQDITIDTYSSLVEVLKENNREAMELLRLYKSSEAGKGSNKSA